jgi:ribosomal-protein-alanine N-acetyltransferase
MHALSAQRGFIVLGGRSQKRGAEHVECALSFPLLRTERLVLRRLCIADAPALFAYCSDPCLAAYVSWEIHRTIRDSEHYISIMEKAYDAGRPANWGVVEQATSELVGHAGFSGWEPNHRSAEIAYVIARRYWSMGYATEVVNEILRFGFETLGLHRIYARCFPWNVASERVLVKNGMVYEGTLRDAVFCKGEFQSLKVFSVLRQEFLARRRTSTLDG